MAIKDSGPLTDFDRLTLHQAVIIVALELLRGRVAGDTERRLAGDVLAAVVDGDLAGTELTRRLEPFGLADRIAAIAVQTAAGARTPVATVEDALVVGPARGGLTRPRRLDAEPHLRPGLRARRRRALRAGRARAAPARGGARRPACGSGSGAPMPGADARRSFHEARCAVEALALGVGGHHGNGNGNGNGQRERQRPRLEHRAVATYKDLGSFQLLLSLQDDEALKLFCDSILGPIEASEGHYGGELMRSLEAFIEENGQWERAARRLYCHRHTLRYRIKRVEELTGRNLSSARDRIEFWLALRGRELVA